MRLVLVACLVVLIGGEPALEAQRRPPPRPTPPFRSGATVPRGGTARAGVPSKPRPAAPRKPAPSPRPRAVETAADPAGAARNAASAAALRKALVPRPGSPEALEAQRLAKLKAAGLRAQRNALLTGTAVGSTLKAPGRFPGRPIRTRNLMTSLALTTLSKKVAGTFRSGQFTEYDLVEDLIVYRVWHPKGAAGAKGAHEFGAYWTTEKPDGSLVARINAAMPPEWGNPATKYTAIRIPKGTRIYSGQAGYQSPMWVGNGNQIIVKNGPRTRWKVEEGVLK